MGERVSHQMDYWIPELLQILQRVKISCGPDLHLLACFLREAPGHSFEVVKEASNRFRERIAVGIVGRELLESIIDAPDARHSIVEFIKLP